MSKTMHRFKDLKIWKLSRALCRDIYKVTSKFPDAEKFGLTAQLRRASVSIPSNIAEGSSRKSNKEFARFLELAMGSIYEIETQLFIALDLTLISKKEWRQLSNDLQSILKMTAKFKLSLN